MEVSILDKTAILGELTKIIVSCEAVYFERDEILETIDALYQSINYEARKDTIDVLPNKTDVKVLGKVEALRQILRFYDNFTDPQKLALALSFEYYKIVKIIITCEVRTMDIEATVGSSQQRKDRIRILENGNGLSAAITKSDNFKFVLRSEAMTKIEAFTRTTIKRLTFDRTTAQNYKNKIYVTFNNYNR